MPWQPGEERPQRTDMSCCVCLLLLCRMVRDTLYAAAVAVAGVVAMFFTLAFASVLEISVRTWCKSFVFEAVLVVFVILIAIVGLLIKWPRIDTTLTPSHMRGPLKRHLVLAVDPEAVCLESACTQDDTCVVCLEPLRCGQGARHLPCGHTFHSPCIDAWWKRQAMGTLTCPTCRGALATV